MPKYSNSSNRQVGKEHLKIPIKAVDFEAIYYYQDDDIVSMKDEAPFYNPVKFKQVINYSGDTTADIDIPQKFVGDFHLVIYTKCNKLDVFDAIELTFNSPDNLPALPLTNSEFEMHMHNRIKRLQFITQAGTKGQICVMIVDKFVPSKAVIDQSGQKPAP